MNSERTAFAFSMDTAGIVSGCPGWDMRENEIDSLRQPGLTEIYLCTYNDYVLIRTKEFNGIPFFDN